MQNNIKYETCGDKVTFFKEGWKCVAQVDNIPELVELVKQHSWSDNNGYLYCGKLKEYLHRVVIEFKIGKDKLSELTKNGFVVDHLNNDEKYNCCLDNLHIISSDSNIAKGHTVDKDIKDLLLKAGIGLFCLKNGLYQIAVGFNIPTTITVAGEVKNIDRLYWNFDNFDKCYIALQTIIAALKGNCDLYVDLLQATNWWYIETILLPEEYLQDKGPLIKYGDTYVFRINNEQGPYLAVIDKPAKVE